MDLIIGAVIGGAVVWFAKDWVRDMINKALSFFNSSGQ